jgi:hypothetical protein
MRVEQALQGALGARPTSPNDADIGRQPDPATRPPRKVTLAGGAGALGSAVLEALLADGRWSEVEVWITQPLTVLLPRLSGRRWDAGDVRAAPSTSGVAPVAVIVFDRARGAHGREAALWLPEARDLLAWARARHAEGARELVVVSPVDTAHWPAALRQGLATLDEQAVAALGWDRLVWLRPASQARSSTGHGLQRLADGVLAQLRWMVPTAQQPLRSSAVARVAAALAAGLPGWSAGVRVLPADLLWQAVQSEDIPGWLQAWWHGETPPPRRAAPRRL